VPEEGVEAVLDDLLGAVGQHVRPRPEPTAERRGGLEERDGDAALGQHDGRADPGDATAHHDGLGAGWCSAGKAGVGGDEGARAHAQRRGAGGGVRRAEHPTSVGAVRRGRARVRNARRAGRVAEDMTVDLGRIGIWSRRDQLTPRLAKDVEALGYGAIWIGGSPPGDLFLAQELLDATSHLAVATGIVNMWATPATEVAESYHRVAAAHPGRFLLGVGIGHPEATREYRSPFDTIVDYLDVLDAEGVPVEDRALAALGPKVLALAAERSAGAHPYLTTPEHTRGAREILGDGPLLAPEQKVVVGTDPDAARVLGRPAVDRPYLHLRNYTTNLKRLGWTDADLADGGSDALIDALVVHGDAAVVAAGLTAHLDAGADHVCLQLLTAPSADPLPDLRALAAALELDGSDAL
jgi:probable F420-dependent oxidoreductase